MFFSLVWSVAVVPAQIIIIMMINTKSCIMRKTVDESARGNPKGTWYFSAFGEMLKSKSPVVLTILA